MTDSMDFSSLLAQAQEMQSKMMSAQAEQAQMILEGSAGAGKVTVQVDGNGEFKGVTIAPEVVDAAEVEMLEDLVLAALKDATAKVADLQMQAIDGLGIPDIGGAMGGGESAQIEEPGAGGSPFGSGTPGGGI